MEMRKRQSAEVTQSRGIRQSCAEAARASQRIFATLKRLQPKLQTQLLQLHQIQQRQKHNAKALYEGGVIKMAKAVAYLVSHLGREHSKTLAKRAETHKQQALEYNARGQLEIN